jgi:putative DNA primase/helicase
VTASFQAEPTAQVRRLRPDQERSDLGNARRLVEAYGQNLRYDRAGRRWLVWDGRRFADDVTGEVERFAKATAEALLREIPNVAGDSERRNAMKHALRSMNAGPLRAMVSLAETEPGIPVQADELDADPMVLNVANGLIDLRTGHLAPHDRAAMCTKLAPVEYHPDAEAPRFQQFLRQVLADDQELAGFLQRLAGYSLTGDTREQVLPVLHGAGRNGKSTLVEILRDAAGDYGVSMPPDLLIARREGSPQPHGLMRLRGARLVTASETDEGARLSVALVKTLTGSDTITARHLYGEFTDFRPQAKFWLSTNHRPRITDSTISIWRRLRLIPFTITISEEDEDKTLPEQLRAELPGILAWAVRGAVQWHRCGLGNASAVQAATADYRADSDQVGAFLEERCLQGATYSARASVLFAAWQQWALSHGENPGSSKAFGQRLAERGLEAGKAGGGTRIWRGVGLLNNDEEDQ